MARVLVIDDEDVIGAVLRYALLEQGHETLLAEGGREGIERALTDHPDAIVLDLMMPEVNGIDVIETLRHEDATRDVPILVLTAVTMAREHGACMEAGADLVLTKPFDPQDVADAVEDLLAPRSPAA